VSCDNRLLRGTVAQKRKVLVCDRDHIGIDLVEPVSVAPLSVGGQRSNPQSDNPHIPRPPRVVGYQRLSHAGRSAIVGGWDAALFARDELRSVNDPSMKELGDALLRARRKFPFDL